MLGSQTSPEPESRQPPIDVVRAALDRLGVDRLVVSIHQASFPPGVDDLGHGSPYSAAGHALLRWLASLGATGVALGPAGITARDNPSPYDATALSRNPLHVALGPLVDDSLLEAALLAAELGVRPAGDNVNYRHAWSAQRRLLAAVADSLRDDPAWTATLASRRAASPWLASEAGFEAIVAAVGGDDWTRWPAAPPVDPAAAWRFEVGQALADQQHQRLDVLARQLGLRLYADLPIGIAHRDRRAWQPLFVPGYAMGAPPSRTNPAGQPWGFPVLDPATLEPGGAGHALVTTRLDRLLDGNHGLRIDHPHGWVCPWVYRTDDPDPDPVQRGARLHESPDLADHPALAGHARVRPEQLDRSRPRHDDAWVRDLEPAQVARYAAVIELVLARARSHGIGAGDLMVEVLSTCPRPLAAVLARFGLGRFRVTQKARLDDPLDVYRGENAAPADWIMFGNHDTPPMRAVIERWRSSGELDARVAYLRGRLGVERIAPSGLTTALLAELFLGPARNVLVFWADLFGIAEIYNRPGVVDDSNWCLRVPADFAAARDEAVARGDAPELAAALALAMQARGFDRDEEGRDIVAALMGPRMRRDTAPGR